MALLDDIAARFGLGRVLPGVVEMHGGVNLLTRLPTTEGAFAIHQLLGLPVSPDPLPSIRRILDLEAAAQRGGVVLAEPVGCGTVDGAAGPVVVHHWVDARPVTLGAPGPGLFTSLGRSLGRLHAVAPPAEPHPGDVLAWHDGRDLLHLLDAWDAEAAGRVVFSHRDLTPDNVLDRGGEAVLIDWESAGPIGTGAEIGRTALDHQLAGDDLVAFLRGYAEATPLPPVGRDWTTLWIRGLVVYEHHCREALRAGEGPPSLLAFQRRVVDTHEAELTRRLGLVDRLMIRFEEAVAAVG